MPMKGIVTYHKGDSELDNFYHQTLQYLRDKYHTHPSALSNDPFTDAEREHISYHDAMGRDLVRHARSRSRRSYRDSCNHSGSSGEINYGKAVF